jgi:hypothetical protein
MLPGLLEEKYSENQEKVSFEQTITTKRIVAVSIVDPVNIYLGSGSE